MKPCALVIEPELSGYRWHYVQWTIEALVEAGYECILWTAPRYRDHPLLLGYEVSRSAVKIASDDWAGDRGHVFPRAVLTAVKASFGPHAAFASVYRRVIRSEPVDLVVVPSGDSILNAAGLLGSPFGVTRWICIVTGQTFHLRDMKVAAPRRPLKELIQKRLFYNALRRGNLSAVLTIDPTLSVWHANSPLAAGCPPLHYLAGPFPDAEYVERREARARLGIGDEHCILVYGAISDGKGIKELLHACMRRREHPRIVVAGEQSEDVRAFIASIGGGLFSPMTVFDQFISPEMEADLFCACDVVWVGYKGHYGMSSVLAQACRYWKTVIATQSGLIGWFAEREGFGPLLPDLSAASINAAIDEALELSGSARAASQSESDELLARDTVHHFKKIVRTALTSS
ncbi:glycosyltransferase [Trinickia dinghuensis]|uniref:Group 1 glycosyl transferase n=1 Tax=Trinickia dinghuensis TaxID=2291023 RepID=A0A3D8JYA3_9BURK|nr:glycosyltransferase [Trinickia dinghuensis]RDU97605.1 group 1 glycosyl transferase [Trinickia dinghuensis]